MDKKPHKGKKKKKKAQDRSHQLLGSRNKILKDK